jgi:hypothetical protein
MTILEAREILGEEDSKKYTDDELERVILDIEAIARFTIHDLIQKRKAEE